MSDTTSNNYSSPFGPVRVIDAPEEGNGESNDPSIAPAAAEDASGARGAIEASVEMAKPRYVNHDAPDRQDADADVVIGTDSAAGPDAAVADEPEDDEVASGDFEPVDPDKHTKDDLIEMAKDAGVAVSGSKTELADRINEARSAQA